jgi:hypothetical protein
MIEALKKIVAACKKTGIRARGKAERVGGY